MPENIANIIAKNVSKMYKQAKTPDATIMTEKAIELCGSLCQYQKKHGSLVKNTLM